MFGAISMGFLIFGHTETNKSISCLTVKAINEDHCYKEQNIF